MSATFSLTGTSRTDEGKGASRRLRHAQQMPAVIYGAAKPAQSITLPFKDVVKALESEAFYSHILTLTIDGQVQQVVLKALQRHPVKNQPLHADFLRVDAEHKITMRVPLHFINLETCIGVKSEGGAIAITASDVEIACYPKDLPEFLTVDMGALHVGTTLHISDIKLPEGVEVPQLSQGHDYDQPIANVYKA
ncbi:50S ribosomal protein L25/general stress protein Ctc [Moraxellaceae bacterium AER2_44_116]|jgi:large subunit ribosomal protein L25|nr:50S ribosomal protein L25/general stress protein Ctc [Moraxellaceae bacterium AER2_44_116]